MKKVILNLFIFTLITLVAYRSYSQGCVAIRSGGMTCSIQEPMGGHQASGWQFTANTRYFKSFRHFVGKEEQKQREELGTEVINKVFSEDLTLTKIVNSRWSFAVNVPVISNYRSSLYEHGGKERRSTHSFGLGDIRFAAYRWMFDPAKNIRGNVQAGLGIKLPTGDYNYKDFFGPDSAQVLGPVDQSIQLGDGGTGITLEINSFYNIGSHVGLYGNLYYLANPREQNGTLNYRTPTPSASSVANKSYIMSVPDQYMIRMGADYRIKKLTLSAGARMECIPVHDLIGGSNGFRRPGYVLSVEPGLTYKLKNVALYCSVPVAAVRDRTQSVPDKIQTNLTGVYRQGDAAFADYSINVGASFRF